MLPLARGWGRNDDGQLGTGDRTRAKTPVELPGLHPAALALGGYHSCALIADGTVQCWGRNDWGQSGQPDTSRSFIVPTTVGGITNAVGIFSGFYNTCAILSDGTTRCWGRNEFGEVGDGSVSPSSLPVQVSGVIRPSAIAVGGFHACARMADTPVR